MKNGMKWGWVKVPVKVEQMNAYFFSDPNKIKINFSKKCQRQQDLTAKREEQCEGIKQKMITSQIVRMIVNFHIKKYYTFIKLYLHLCIIFLIINLLYL